MHAWWYEAEVHEMPHVEYCWWEDASLDLDRGRWRWENLADEEMEIAWDGESGVGFGWVFIAALPLGLSVAFSC